MPLYFIMKDLQSAIADYYKEKDTVGETVYTMCSSVETQSELPEYDNEEGDVRYVKDSSTYYIYDSVQWNLLLSTPIDQENYTFATEEEILEALKAGETNG